MIYKFYFPDRDKPWRVINADTAITGSPIDYPSEARIKAVLAKQARYTKLFLDDNGEIVMRLTVEEG